MTEPIQIPDKILALVPDDAIALNCAQCGVLMLKDVVLAAALQKLHPRFFKPFLGHRVKGRPHCSECLDRDAVQREGIPSAYDKSGADSPWGENATRAREGD